MVKYFKDDCWSIIGLYRWFARVVGFVVIGLLLKFVIDWGIPDIKKGLAGECFFVHTMLGIAIIGYIITWFFELIGALILIVSGVIVGIYFFRIGICNSLYEQTMVNGLLSFPFLGVIFLIYRWENKPHKFKVTKFKTRMNYALGLDLFFTLIFFFLARHNIGLMVKGLLLGVVLFVPLYFSSKKWIDKNIKGTTIFYDRKESLRTIRKNQLWTILFMILIPISVFTGFWEEINEVIIGIGLGLGFSWFIAQVFILFCILKIEKKLGAPILLDER